MSCVFLYVNNSLIIIIIIKEPFLAVISGVLTGEYVLFLFSKLKSLKTSPALITCLSLVSKSDWETLSIGKYLTKGHSRQYLTQY